MSITRGIVILGLLCAVTLAGCAADRGKRVVYPLNDACGASGRARSSGGAVAKPTQITDECVAAAVAENTFLEHTQGAEPEYSIWPMDHTQTDWRFMVMGMKHGVPGPGEHWMVTVKRETGETEVVDGE